jgi:hypothetical protein
MSASPVAFGAPKSPADRNRKRKPVPTMEAPRPRPALGKIALLVAGLGLGIVTALTVTAETSSQLSAPGGLFTFVGSLTGMIGTYLALIMVLLVSRIPFVERVAGQDGLVRLHRAVAPGRSACSRRTRSSLPSATRPRRGQAPGTRPGR